MNTSQMEGDGTMQSEEKEEGMFRLRGMMPGGGMLVNYRIEVDAFGVLAQPAIRAIGELSLPRKERRKAYKDLERILNMYRILHEGERIVCISLGSDDKGNPTILVQALRKGGLV